MAIIVTNPSTVQFSGSATEPQDPAAMTLEAGFTEELANAMQPPGQQSDSAAASQKLAVSAAEAKLNDLQILPADVLLNAVGEANFAFSQQVAQVATTPQAMEEAVEQVAITETLDPTQAAELAAAALAAQMASPMPSVTDNAALLQTANSENAIDGIDAVGTLNAAQLANDAALAQGSLPQASAQALTQASQAVLNGTPNLQTVDSVAALNAGSQSQSQVLTELAQNLTSEVDAMGQGSPGQLDATSKLAVEPLPVQLPIGRALEGQTEIPKPAQAQTLESFNQTKIEVISNGPADLANTPVVTSDSSSVTTPSSLAASQIGKETASASVDDLGNTGFAVSSIEGQLSAFDLAGSDVARPGADASANPVQLSAANPTQAAIQPVALEATGLQKQVIVNASEELASKAVDTRSPLNDSAGLSLQNSAADSEQESAFKFDAKLGAKPPSLAEAPKSLAASVASKPVSLGGAVAPQASSINNGQGVLGESAVQTNLEMTQNGSTEDIAGKLEAGVNFSPSVSGNALNTNASTVGIQAASEQKKLANNLQVSSTEQDVSEELLNDLQGNQFTDTTGQNGVAPKRDQDLRTSSKLEDADTSNDGVLANLGAQQAAVENTLSSFAQSESVQPVAKGFSEVSATFVSSLVGGPQRPVTTVMDWVALKPQEPPRPVMPHELRLDAGAVQVEIQRMVKQGGGHVVMELTPPDQSKFTIELKLDDNGGAYLRVEGVSDSTKTRLEQSAPQLQEQFQQMGLNLQLDMRQNRDSSSSTAAEWMANESGSNDLQTQESSPQATRAVAAERARKNNGGQVYLYA